MLKKKPKITRENPETPPDKANKPETKTIKKNHLEDQYLTDWVHLKVVVKGGWQQITEQRGPNQELKEPTLAQPKEGKIKAS